MTNKIILLGPSSGSNVFQHFSESLGTQFASIGITSVTLDLQATDFQQRLLSLVQESPLAVLGFAGIGGMFNIDGKNLWELSRTPFISFFGDSPAYYPDLHFMGSNWQFGMYGFPEHVALRKRLSMNHGFVGVVETPFMLPPLIEKTVDIEKKMAGKLVFPKTGNSSLKLRNELKESLPEPVFAVWESIAAIIDGNLNTVSHDSVWALVEEHMPKLSIDGPFVAKIKLLLTALLDDYARRLESELVADVLMDYPAIVCGSRWEHLNISNRTGTYVPVSDYAYTDQLIADSLAVVHVSPNTSHGIHDRQLRAIAHGTACLSNRQRFVSDSYNLNDEIVYDFDTDSLRDKIEWVLANKEEVVRQGMGRPDSYRQKFHISNFYNQIIKIAEIIRFSNADIRPAALPDYLVWPPLLG